MSGVFPFPWMKERTPRQMILFSPFFRCPTFARPVPADWHRRQPAAAVPPPVTGVGVDVLATGFGDQWRSARHLYPPASARLTLAVAGDTAGLTARPWPAGVVVSAHAAK